jgi:hypothetical protein
LKEAKVDERVSTCSAGQTCYQVLLTIAVKLVPSLWSASEGATPDLKNFLNMLYIVGHVVLASAIIIISSNSGKKGDV